MTEIEELKERFSTDITNLWRAKEWDDKQLHYYINQRFGRPLEQLAIYELNVIKDELV